MSESIESREKKFKGTLYSSDDPFWAYNVAEEFLSLYNDKDIVERLSRKTTLPEGEVIKYLEKAKETGYLEPSTRLSKIETEQRLEESYEVLFKISEKEKSPLKFILVVETKRFELPTPLEEQNWRAVIDVAANYFINVVNDYEKVGFSGGRMPLAFAQTICTLLKQRGMDKYENLEVQALAGNVDPNCINVSANSVVALFANLIGNVKARGLETFPVITTVSDVKLKDYKDNIIANHWIKGSLREAKNVKFAFTGIGTIEDKNFALTSLAKILKKYNILNDNHLKQFKKDVVGDILYIPLNEEGKRPKDVASKTIMNRLIGVDYNDLQKMAANKDKRVMAIAGGTKKARAIHAAIKGKLINALIIDEMTARLLVKKCQDEIKTSKTKNRYQNVPSKK